MHSRNIHGQKLVSITPPQALVTSLLVFFQVCGQFTFLLGSWDASKTKDPVGGEPVVVTNVENVQSCALGNLRQVASCTL